MDFFHKKLAYWAQQQQEARPVMPTEGLVFWASLNGNTPNKAETGQTLTLVGTAPTYTTVDGVPCATGAYQQWAYTFPGSGLPTVNANRTLSFWSKTTAESGIQPMFGQVHSPSARQAFFLFHGTGNGNKLRFNLSSTNYTSDYDVPFFRWNHVLVVKTGAKQYEFYINGEKVRTWNPAYNAATTTGDGAINFYNGNIYGGCPIASCRIYNRVLTQDEITVLAHEFTPTA